MPGVVENGWVAKLAFPPAVQQLLALAGSNVVSQFSPTTPALARRIRAAIGPDRIHKIEARRLAIAHAGYRALATVDATATALRVEVTGAPPGADATILTLLTPFATLANEWLRQRGCPQLRRFLAIPAPLVAGPWLAGHVDAKYPDPSAFLVFRRLGLHRYGAAFSPIGEGFDLPTALNDVLRADPAQADWTEPFQFAIGEGQTPGLVYRSDLAELPWPR